MIKTRKGTILREVKDGMCSVFGSLSRGFVFARVRPPRPKAWGCGTFVVCGGGGIDTHTDELRGIRVAFLLKEE